MFELKLPQEITYVTPEDHKMIRHSRHRLREQKVIIDQCDANTHLRIVGYFYQDMFILYGYCTVPSRTGLGSFYLGQLKQLIFPHRLAVTGILQSALPFWHKMQVRGLVDILIL